MQIMHRSQKDVAVDAGVSAVTLSSIMNGRKDFKVETLLAIVDRLGLEVVLLPKGTGYAVAPTAGPATPSIIDLICKMETHAEPK